MGSQTIVYIPSTGGKIYTVPLQYNDGSIVSFKAFCVKDILGSNVGRSLMKFNPKDFPHIPESTLVKVGKILPKKALEILIGNPNLSLQPCCHRGFGCPDCEQDRCLYRSKFGCGWVPLGRFGSEKMSSIGSIKHIAHLSVNESRKKLVSTNESELDKLVSTNEPETKYDSVNELRSEDNVTKNEDGDRISQLESIILELVKKLDAGNMKIKVDDEAEMKILVENKP